MQTATPERTHGGVSVETPPRVKGISITRLGQQDVAPVPQPAPRVTRAYAVDALRGLAFLCVVLGEAKPYEVLPAWMYHAQEPPPTHAIVPDLAGLTFPDLVFPFFLFTMGVAIPLALTSRLERGAGIGTILRRGVVTRFLLLMFLALFRQHFDNGAPAVAAPERWAWVVGLIGFVVLFAIFTRLPESWSRHRRLAVRAVGWTAAVLMFAFIQFPDGSHFKLDRIDDILVINAYCAAFATLIWLATRRNVMARLAILVALASFHLIDGHDGWLNNIYNFEPFPALYNFSFFEYLCISIPGTIIGDLVVAWSRTPQLEPAPAAERWPTSQTAWLAIVLFGCVPLLLVGIQSRQVFVTTALAAMACACAFYLTRRPGNPAEALIARLVGWGTFWLLLGLLLDPLEGGTRKEPPTFAWYFQGCGLAIFVLVTFFIITQVWQRRRWLQLFIDNGQNPMMGYVGYGMLMLPLLGLTGIKEAIESAEPAPWVAFAWSLVVTLMVALVVRFFTRRKLFWRS